MTPPTYPHPPYTPRPPPSLTTLDSLSALSHLSPHDRALFRQFGFGPHRTIPYPIVHHAFEAHARSQPHAIAIEHHTLTFHHTITYAELDRRANRLARRLRDDASVRTGVDRVCIVARRSIDFVSALLAVLKAGAQYVPIDGVTVTDKTLVHILRDASPRVVLVMDEYRSRVQEALRAGPSGQESAIVVPLEHAMAEDDMLARDASKIEDKTVPTDGCYVIYTSGTTGTPKGVDVRHNGVANVICGPPGNVQMSPGMRVAQLLNIAFDMGAWEILSSLYNGCTLCLRGNTSKEWVALMKTVDVVISTPSILARHDPRDYPNLKEVIVGGEVCPQALADAWGSSGIHFYNCCGPTEISICNTVQPHLKPSYSLSIGTPLPNTSLYILDSTWEPPSASSFSSSSSHPRALPIGSAGLMYVGGLSPSRGYLNLPTLTHARWLPDPFRPDVPGAMMFNTGDLGRWRLQDGQLDHLGRVDEQVKVKGFRVELEGVSVAMWEVGQYRRGQGAGLGTGPGLGPGPGAAREEEVASEGPGGKAERVKVASALALLIDGHLWGFLSPQGVDLPHIIEGTKRIQPYYAVPTKWALLDAFPMTRNGKVDKRRLREVAEEQERGTMEGTTGMGGNGLLGGSPPTPSSVPTTPIPRMNAGASAGAGALNAAEMRRAFPPPPPVLSIPPGVRGVNATANAHGPAQVTPKLSSQMQSQNQNQNQTQSPSQQPTHLSGMGSGNLSPAKPPPRPTPPPPHWTVPTTLEYEYDFDFAAENEVVTSVAQTQSVQV